MTIANLAAFNTHRPDPMLSGARHAAPAQGEHKV